jgi:hypothetical protein
MRMRNAKGSVGALDEQNEPDNLEFTASGLVYKTEVECSRSVLAVDNALCHNGI